MKSGLKMDWTQIFTELRILWREVKSLWVLTEVLSVSEKGEGKGKMTLRMRHNNTNVLILLNVFLLTGTVFKSSVAETHFCTGAASPPPSTTLNLNQHFFIESVSPSDPTTPPLFGNHFCSPLYWNEFYVCKCTCTV